MVRPAAGVGAVILRGRGDAQEVLLIQRSKPPNAGGWTFPGGALEPGEGIRAAVAREAWEETGLRVCAGPLVEVVEVIERGDDGALLFHYVIFDHLCELLGDDAPEAGDDAAAARWWRLDALEAPELIGRTAAVALKAAWLRAGGETPA